MYYWSDNNYYSKYKTVVKIRESILKLRCTIQRLWFILNPKPIVTEDDMCNNFCHLPDKVEIYLKTNTGKQQSINSTHPFEILGFVDNQIKIKENGN